MRRSWLRLFWLTVVLVGAVAGYLVSSGLGTRLLDREIEIQLSRLLEGPVEIGEVDVRWENGVLVEARDVSAYPSPTPGAPPALRARRVLAWVDLVALLIGRLELSTLILEGPHVRIVKGEDGSFVGLPLLPISPYPDEGLDDRSEMEQIFARLAALDLSASAFADRIRAADRIEVLDGTLSWVDGSNANAGSGPRSLRIELFNGLAVRNWLSDAIAVEWSGVFVDGEHVPFPFEVDIRRDEGKHFVWSLELSRIPLAAAETPLAFVEGIEGLAGTLDVRLRLETEPAGLHRVSISGRVEDAQITLRRSRTRLEHDLVEVSAELVIDPYEVQLISAHLEGDGSGVDLKGAIQRPIRPASPTRIESRTQSLRLEDVASYARSLETESKTALTIVRLTERVQSGHIRTIEAAGTAPLERWQALADGRALELPTGFVLSGAFDEVTVASGPNDQLEKLAGEVEWAGDQLIFRNGNAIFRGRPLPQINAVINGVSHLVRTNASARKIALSPPATPGIRALSEIIKPRNPNALPPIKAIALAIDRLEHPIFRWPLRGLRVLVEPLRRGLEINIREGSWGGAAVSGEIVWFNDPVAPSVSATLTLGPPPEVEEPTPSAPVADRWGSGRFEMEFRPRRWLPFEKGSGRFRLEGPNLIGDDLKIELAHQGTIAARMTLELTAADSIGFDTSFALTDGRLAEVGPFVALPADLATGAIGATGSLVGRVRPDKPFAAELDGRVRAEASGGRVYTNLPLMLRLAKATEGFNPFADQGDLQYETMTGSFEFSHGKVSVADFEIEGPLRVFARANIDTNERPSTIRAVVGIFLFRQPSQILESLPVLRFFLPGSERGLIGTYFEVDGAISEPNVEALPLQSLMTGVPSAIKAPFKALRFLFDRTVGDS
ncbi:MAG: hypothetical protein GY910_26165 [bacterium]|nr:hypothetical protein [bacterium]